MAKKLGEILLERGVISPKQLKKALDAQLIFGGRVGTNLIELGFVDEATLANALEEQKSASVAAPEKFQNVPSRVIRTLPSSLVKRHKVVPLEVEDKLLTVAMLDPNDLVVLDEISFVTGMKVKALLSPEARIHEAMETYYGIPRPMRFVTLSDEIRRQIETRRDPDATGGEPATSAGPWAVDIGRQDSPEAELVVGAVDTVHEEERPEEERKAAAQALADLRRAREREAAARMEEERRRAPPTIEEAGEALARVETRDEIGDVLIGFAAPRFRRAALFILQKGRTLGWKGQGEAVDAARVRAIQVPRDLPSVFDALTGGSGYYLGEVEDLPGNEILLQGLGGGSPEVAFVLPVPFQDRNIAALYGDGSLESMRSLDVRTLRALVRKAGLAMEILLLRQRILQ